MSALKDAKAGNKSKDSQSPVKTCPLSKEKIQLIPLRYGLVEGPDPAGQLAMPYKTVSRPLGVRLVRNGWIYAVVERNHSAILHEYRVKQGKIEALLWNKAEVSADVRTSSVGDAKMIFKRSEPLYVAYSEVQWTAKKCSRVIKSASQRKQLMQSVSLSSVHPEKGGKDLLGQAQAERWVAECATTKPVQEKGALPQETPYHWEYDRLYQTQPISALRQTVSPECEQNYLFVVLQDDIGVLRDLAAYQDQVGKWINEWQQDEVRNQQYAEACYIESQLELSKEELEHAQKSMTPDELDTLKEQHQRQVEGVSAWRFWDGSAGQQGIKDLINQPEMEAFLKAQRKIHQRWELLLGRITQDRVALFPRFYHAAWYFDVASSEQVKEALAAEYSCIQDLCRTDEAISAVSKQLDNMPWVLYPLAYTAAPDQLAKLQENISARLKDFETLRTMPDQQADLATHITTLAGRLNAASAATLSGQLDALLDEKVAAFADLIRTSYRPAMTVGLANAVQEIFERLNATAQFNPANLLRPMGNAARLTLLQAHALQGITVSFASGAELTQFDLIAAEVTRLRGANIPLKNELRQLKTALRRSRGGRHTALVERIETAKSARKANQLRLTQLEPVLQRAMSPVGPGPAKVGYQIAGLSADEMRHFQTLAQDQDALYRGARSRWSAGTLDTLGFLIAFWQGYNLSLTARNWAAGKSSAIDLWRDSLTAISSTFAAVQGLLTTYDLAALRAVSGELASLKIMARLGRMTATLGGASYGTALLANVIKFYQAADATLAALRSGDRRQSAKGALEMATSGAQIGVYGYGALRSAQIIGQVMRAAPAARAALWAANAGRLLTLTMRMTVLGLVASAVEVAITVAFNRSYLPDYIAWFERTRWGKAPRFATLAASHLALARISAKPKAELTMVSRGMMLSLSFPALTLDDLTRAGVTIAFYWGSTSQRNEWQDWSELLEQQWVCLSQPGAPLQLGLPIYPEEQTAGSIAIALSYKPTPVAAPDTLYLEKAETKSAGPLYQVPLLRVRQQAAPRPLTADVVITPDIAPQSATGAR